MIVENQVLLRNILFVFHKHCINGRQNSQFSSLIIVKNYIKFDILKTPQAPKASNNF